MRIFKPKRKKADGSYVNYERWYIEFWDHNNIQQRIPGLKNQKASEEIGNKIEKLVALKLAGEKPDVQLVRWLEVAPGIVKEKLGKFGVIDMGYAVKGMPLKDYLEDYGLSLKAKNATPRHISESRNKLLRVFSECGFKRVADIDAEKFSNWLARQRETIQVRTKKTMSIQTSNEYLKVAKAFLNWMLRTGRISINPLSYLQRLNAATDVRHKRRALTPDEAKRLIIAAEKGPVYQGISGPDRAMLYRLALETGLRLSELKSLEKRSFDFNGNPPTVTVEAAHSKHRRKDVLPLRVVTAGLFQNHCRNMMPVARVFTTIPWKPSEMIRADLEAAGIPYKDDSNQYADFHALRHTFISNMAMSGVHPKVAQSLARHSTIQLTMDCYSHVSLGSQVEALERVAATI